MFAVENVIRSATRRSSGDPLNILTICNNNEKYIALLCATGHNFFLLKRAPFNWKAPIENKPSNLQVIDQNWPSSYFDMILCNDRLDQYHFAAELSQSFHLPIVLIDHCSSHVIKPECAFGTVSVDSPEALIRNCAANVCTSEYANKSWGFNISKYESVQFTEYQPKGHYNWHNDSMKNPMNLKNMQRKLSVSLQLSKPEDYDGGDLKFNLRGLDSHIEDNIMSPPPEFKQQGSVVIFPSFLWHKVEPITRGTRYSLVVWALGENWK